MRQVLAIAATLMLFFSLTVPLPVQATVEGSEEVEFGCEALEDAVKAALLNIKELNYDKEDPVTTEHIEQLKYLSINAGKDSQGTITCLDGLEHAINLKKFHMTNNTYQPLDYSPLLGLENLEEVKLHNVPLSSDDLAVLAEIGNLKYLYLSNIAGITNFSPLGDMEKLTHLYLINMGLGTLATEDFAFLANIKKLQWLELQKNSLTNLDFLEQYGSDLENLWKIILDNNDLSATDISPLTNLNLSSLQWVYLQNCKLDFEDDSVKNVIAELQDNGVKIKPVLATDLSLEKSSISLEEGQWFKLGDYVTVAPSWAILTWSSSNTGVAKVDGNGKVLARNPGTATITVSSGDFEAACTITVTAKDEEKEEEKEEQDKEDSKDNEKDQQQDDEEDQQDVTSLTLSPQRLTMLAGGQKQLSAKVRPQDSPLAWASDNEEVATVSQEGKVTAHNPGTATITVSSGDWEGRCTIIVKPDATGEKLSIKLDEEHMHTISIPSSRIHTDSIVEISHLNLLLHIPTSAWQGAIANLGIEDYEDVEVIIESFVPDQQEKLQPVGKGYRFQLILNNQPVSNFDGFLTLSFSYDPDTVENPDKLTVCWFDPETEKWVELESEVDKQNHIVSAQIDHWSTFTLMMDTTESNLAGWYIIAAVALLMATILLTLWYYRRNTVSL